MRTRHMRPLIAVLAMLGMATTFFALPASADEGDVVGNPGPFTITVSGGRLAINEPLYIESGGTQGLDMDLTPAELPQCSDGEDNDADTKIDYPDDPQCTADEDNSELAAGFQPKEPITIAGTVAADGTINVPADGVHFPTSYLEASGAIITATIGSTAPSTGTLDPVTGEMDLSVSLGVNLKFTLFATPNNCNIGPLEVALTTGETDPPGPNEPIFGDGYLDDGTFKLVNNDFGVDAIGAPAGCPFGTILDAVVGLPADAGTNTAIFAGATDVVFAGPGAENTPPVADAGEDLVVASGATVTLDGTGSSDADDDALTYSWTQTDGTEVTLDDATSATPSFTAPTGPDSLEFSLVVNDGTDDSEADTVSVTVNAPVPPSTPPVADFDGDGTTDRSVFRPEVGGWYVEGQDTVFLGLDGDVPVPADYDGDGTTDRAVFRPETGAWFIEGEEPVYLGSPSDVPVPADYDGDGSAEIAVFRPEAGAWFIEGEEPVYLGSASDVPVPADYDGDGSAEVAVFRPEAGAWFIGEDAPVYFGIASDVPVPADYDGDGAVDVAVWRDGAWHVSGGSVTYLGLAGDVPTPGNFDGVGATDQAVFRSGTWFGASTDYWGLPGDLQLVLPQAIALA